MFRNADFMQFDVKPEKPEEGTIKGAPGPNET